MFPHSVFAPFGRVVGPIVSDNDNEMKDVFLFDMDVLLPSAATPLDDCTLAALTHFVQCAPCYLLTSASYKTVVELFPSLLRLGFAGIYANAGTEFWRGHTPIWRDAHIFPETLRAFVEEVRQTSQYRHGCMEILDEGSATLRICLAGMKSSARQRRAYLAWEQTHQELPFILSEFRRRFPTYRIFQDSDASLLIVPRHLSSVRVHQHLLETQTNARIIGYLSPSAYRTYARGFAAATAPSDVVSVVSTPANVRQLLSYEERRMAGHETVIAMPNHGSTAHFSSRHVFAGG